MTTYDEAVKRSISHAWDDAKEAVKPWLNGKPYYCNACGLGMAEFLACEDGGCELESEDEAIARQLRAQTSC